MKSRRTLCAPEGNTNRRSFNNHFTNDSLLITDPLITDQLRRRLLALDFPAFARCVCRLLDALGYENAQPTGRREWKGYNRPGRGGYDLEAALPGGMAPRHVIAQVKQYDILAVHQRNVDELRGACLRAGASEAVLVTTSTFSEVVRRSERIRMSSASPEAASSLVAPVRLIDGEELVRLLIRHRLGVRERGLGKIRLGRMKLGRIKLSENTKSENVRFENVRLEIDEAFFRSIATPSVGKALVPRRSPGWHVTIRISSDPNSDLTSSGSKTESHRDRKPENEWKKKIDVEGRLKGND